MITLICPASAVGRTPVNCDQLEVDIIPISRVETDPPSTLPPLKYAEVLVTKLIKSASFFL